MHAWLIPAGDVKLWQGAVEVLLDSCVNLMKAIGELVKDTLADTTTKDGQSEWSWVEDERK